MTGYELRSWRRKLGWSREKAAAELDVSYQTYKEYEYSDQLKRSIALATVTLTLRHQLSVFKQERTSDEVIRELLRVVIDNAVRKV